MSIENFYQEKQKVTIPGFYVAIPLPDCLQKEWLKFKYQNIPDLKMDITLQEMKKKPHITLKYFGNISPRTLAKIDTIIYYEYLHLLKSETVRITGLAIIGETKRTKAFVGLVECSGGIWKFREVLDREFPKTGDLSFLPHITIQETHTNYLIERARKLINLRGGYKSDKAEIYGIYASHRGDLNLI